jgi:putative restriction endonuclease
MAVSFDSIVVGDLYTRPELADIWGYAGPQVIYRGLFTPARDNKIILFITRERRVEDEQYENKLVADVLTMDGPNGHSSEDRMLHAARIGDEVHLFYRDLHSDPFCYYGQIDLIDSKIYSDKPSRFSYRLRDKK